MLEESQNSDINSTNELNKIIDYYLSGQKLPSKSREVGQQLILLLVSISGASLYAMPANELAIKHSSPLAGHSLLMRQINYIVSTCTSGLTVLYIATDTFLNTWRNEAVPEKLKTLLNSTAGNRNLQAAFILTGAAISAIPLVMVSIAYPLPFINTLPLKLIQSIVIGVDNTILHFLPLKLAMQYPIYRLPVLPIEIIYNCCQEKNTLPDNQDAETIRQAMIDYIHYVQSSIQDRCSWGFFVYHWEASFRQNVIRKMQHLKTENFIEMLLAEFPFDDSAIKQSRSKIHDWLGTFSGLLGALWVGSSFSGYYLSFINQTLSLTGSLALTGIIASPSLYFLGVLLTFLGYSASKQLYEYLTSWDKHDVKLPLEFKLYPKTFSLLMILNVYMLFYGYAGAEELVHDNFTDQKWDAVRPILIWLARTGIGFLGLSANKDFVQTFLRKFAMHFGSSETRIIARLMAALEQLEYAIRTAKPEVFSDSKDYLKKMGIISDNIATEETPFLINAPDPKQENGWCSWVKNKCCSLWQNENTSLLPQVQNNQFFSSLRV